MGGQVAAVWQVWWQGWVQWWWRLATHALRDWGKRAQVSFMSEEEEEEGWGSRVLTSLVSMCSL
jgi:hypothetical protein